MEGMQLIRKTLKQRAKRVVALVCVACFFVVFLFVSALHGDHTEYESLIVCPITSERVCYCESNASIPLTSISLLDSSSIEPTSSADFASACHTCALIVKTSGQLRQLVVHTSTLSIADQASLVLFALSLISSLLSIYSPMELKVKMSN